MKLRNRFKLFYLLVVKAFFLVFTIEGVYAQSIESQKYSVFNVLDKGAEIPGVSAFLLVKSKNTPSDSALTKVKAGIWHSDTLSNIQNLLFLSNRLVLDTFASKEIQFLIFDDPADSTALETYFGDLVKNEIYIPDLGPALPNSQGELIILGNKIPFKPFYKIKIQILSDMRMILLIVVLSLFFVIALILVLAISVIKTRKKAHDVQVARFKNLIYEPLSRLLFEFSLEELKEMDVAELTAFFPVKFIKQKLFQDVLIQELISLNKNMKGDFKPKIKLVYRKLSLDVRSCEKLKSNRWDIINTGITEINELDLVEALPKIRNFVNSKNFYIRSNAVGTLMNISPQLDLNILATQTYPLSRWQQMNYLRIVRYKKNIGDIEILFRSGNESVRIFAIKTIEVLGLANELEPLTEKYPSFSDKEKIAALKCFRSFGFIPNTKVLYPDLESENEELVLQSIGLLKIMEDSEVLETLFNKLVANPSFALRKTILGFVFQVDKNAYFSYLENNADEMTRAIHLHLTDPILSNV